MIRFLSLFSGIGGMDLGLERAGMICVGQVEYDPFCRLILEKHWPGLPKWNDVRNFRKPLWENYCRVSQLNSHVDLVCGGFPCQDISVGGDGEGLSGPKSRLWYQMRRVVEEFRPRWVLVENVSALRIRGADTVLSGLESLSYTCWPVVVGAWSAGTPHCRNRAWLVADSGGERLPAGRSVSFGTKSILSLSSGGGLYRGVAKMGQPRHSWEEPRLLKFGVGRAVDDVPERLVRLNNGHALKSLGNAVVPDVVLVIGKAIAARHVGAI